MGKDGFGPPSAVVGMGWSAIFSVDIRIGDQSSGWFKKAPGEGCLEMEGSVI